MNSPYFAVFVLLCMSAGFGTVMVGLSVLLGPKRYSEIKDQPFECGTVGSGEPGGRHSVRYYLVAMTFIVFDVEIAFLYPWAATVRELGWGAFLGMLPFLGLLALGLLYEVRRGVFDLR